MTRLRIRSVIQAPIDEVFDLYTNPSRRREWQPFGRLREQSGPIGAPGTTAVWETPFGKLTTHILRVEPPRLHEMTERFGDGPEQHVRVRLEPVDGGTLLDVESSWEVTGRFARLRAAIQWLGASGWGRAEIRRFRRAAERAHGRAQDGVTRERA